MVGPLGGSSLMTLLYYDSLFLEHDTGSHPESADRVLPAAGQLEARIAAGAAARRWDPISRERATRVHESGYLDAVEEFAQAGGGYIEHDTVVSPRSYDVARLAAGAVSDAVLRVVRGEDKRAFCLVRPPGHHALPHTAMGFCLLNHVAIASRLATTELGLDRVLIVDWDVHHGNGTQDIFWQDGRVAFFSIHRWPFYPGTGGADETGAGDGLGTTLNLPTAFGTSPDDYLSRFTSELERFAAKMKPQLVLISAGFDGHRLDPVGSLGLESEDFVPQTRAVLDIADAYAGGRIVSVLEGGYHRRALAECIDLHLNELFAQDGRESNHAARS